MTADYSAAELRRFQEAFAEASNRRARLILRFLAFFLLAGLSFFIVYYGPDRIKPFFFALTGGCFLVAFLSLRGFEVKCPACRGLVDQAGFGRHCPCCGAPSLKQKFSLRVPRCGACGTELRRSRRRRLYLIRACTHCGVMLDPKGF